MQSIADILSSAAGMSTAELETEKHLRDGEVERLRSEQMIIHTILEPRWRAAQAAQAGPPSLRQTIVDLKGGN